MDTTILPNNEPAGVYVQMPTPKKKFLLLDAKPNTVTSARNSQLIHAAIEDYFGYSLEYLKRQNRKREVVFARQISMYLHEKTTNYTLKNIGIMYGGRDHTTVIHSKKQVNGYLTAKGYNVEKTILESFFIQYGFEL
jgi:chromosomal replication initiation ATPase DnaA